MQKLKVNLLKSNHKKSKREILVRILWYFIWHLTANWPLRFLNPWRRFILRIFGAKIGDSLIMDGVWIDMPWNLEVGDFSAIGRNVWLYNFSKIKIGSHTVVSQNTVLCTASHDYSHAHMTLFSKPITIEDQAWVAADCFVMPGVTIEEGCVIGARSVVTKSMPAWMVCAGHPCKPIKNREINI